MAGTPDQGKRSIGERRLAAIMFTDVVGFSLRVKQNEALAIRLLKRDFEAIKKYCAANGGRAPKTTGDGLLLSFPTASAAVACAQQVQTMLVHNARRNPPEQVLEHRIGIHLGDVFVDEGDVMGNDVNIAARVRSEAGGGEICVSQTVYDVVNNRLAIKGVFLGRRELKNVGEVPIYRLPLSEEEARVAAATQAPAEQTRGWSRAVVVIVTALLAISGLTAWTFLHGGSNHANLKSGHAFAAMISPTTISTTQSTAVPLNGPPTARFVATLERGGDWKGVFGSTAALVFGDYPASLPAFPLKIPLERDAPGPLEVSFAGGTLYTMPQSPQVLRIGLEKLHSSDRILTTFGGPDTARIGLRFPDAKHRRVTIYCAHAGRRDPPRSQVVQIIDPVTGNMLASTTMKGYAEGMYVTFDIAGPTELRIHSLDQIRSVVSGIFIDPPAPK